MKKNKGVVITLVSIIVLVSIVAVVSLVYNFLGGFYYCRVVSYDKMLGEELIIEVNGEGAYVSTCNFSGSLVVDVNIKQPVFVQINNVENPLYLRAKFGINGVEFLHGYMYDSINWVASKDGYLYFNQIANAYDKISLCNEIKLQIQDELKSSTNYVMYFVIETSKTAWEYEMI